MKINVSNDFVYMMIKNWFKVIAKNKNKVLYRPFNEIEQAKKGYLKMANGGDVMQYLREKHGFALLDFAAEDISDNVMKKLW